MKTYTIKRVVVGIVLTILVSGFCLAASGAVRTAAHPGHGGMREARVYMDTIR
ncbi:MAG: hypothetical protein IJQ36_03560 [Oscillospiraceae bacterium]|nr:hypothetical protein [Oscillospiraceae bacterium]